jgi:hypothetical protein
MLLQQRIESFVELRNHLFLDEEMFARIANHNPWFVPSFVSHALENIRALYLDEQKLKEWIYSYPIPEHTVSKNIGVIAAGNIPLVCFQDLMCVLLLGHKLKIKLSEKDNILPRFVIDTLIKIDAKWKDKIEIVEQLKSIDALIATGSNNTSRYFEYYFSKYPNIIRKNRNSVAILSGEESNKELELLADDICMYFGMGCRNITHLYIPEGYNFFPIISALEKYSFFIDHHRYKSNLDYYRTIKLMNLTPLISVDFINLSENKHWMTAISDVNFSYYKDVREVISEIEMNKENLQCVVATQKYLPYTIALGESQSPSLYQYPDDVDIMKFLIGIL